MPKNPFLLQYLTVSTQVPHAFGAVRQINAFAAASSRRRLPSISICQHLCRPLAVQRPCHALAGIGELAVAEPAESLYNGTCPVLDGYGEQPQSFPVSRGRASRAQAWVVQQALRAPTVPSLTRPRSLSERSSVAISGAVMTISANDGE